MGVETDADHPRFFIRNKDTCVENSADISQISLWTFVRRSLHCAWPGELAVIGRTGCEGIDFSFLSLSRRHTTVFSKRMGLAAAALFCRRFGTAIRTGMDLLRLLELESQQGPAAQRSAMNQLHDGAKKGEALSEIMQQQKPFFPPLLIAMTRVGEATGRLDRTLLALATHYDHRLTLRRTFTMSIVWPGIQLVGGIFVISLLIYLLGMLTPPGGGEMLDVLGFGLKGGEGVLIFWGYLAMIFGAIAMGIWGYTNNIGGVQNIVPLVYKIPVFGPAVQTITLARFCWTLSLCFDSGLDPIQSIKLSLDSTDSDFYRSAADETEASIRAGETLAGTLKATHLFPEDFITQIEIAEMSGTDAESIDGLAQAYDERARGASKTLSGIATGIVWLTVLGALLFIIIRMIMIVFGGYFSTIDDLLGPQ